MFSWRLRVLLAVIALGSAIAAARIGARRQEIRRRRGDKEWRGECLIIERKGFGAEEHPRRAADEHCWQSPRLL